MAVKTYNPEEVVIIIGGIIAEGFSDDQMISIEPDEDAFSLSIGVQGKGTRTKSNNNSATIRLFLGQSSATNALLSALHALDKSAGNGAGVVPLLVNDKSGLSLHTAVSCWVQRAPAAGYGREAGSREWVLRTDSLDVNLIGGN